MNITGFDKIAPYLTNPLVLAGFVLMLVYGIHWQLMKSGLLARATKKDSALIIRLFLRYGFWLALVLLLAGLGFTGWSNYADRTDRVDASRRSVKTVEPPHKESTALTAYRKEVELDPDNPEHWNKLGILLLHTGELAQAEAAYRKVLALGEAGQDKEDQAGAYGNLGLVYRIRGNPDQAEAYWKKSLRLYEEMGAMQNLDAEKVQQWLDNLAR